MGFRLGRLAALVAVAAAAALAGCATDAQPSTTTDICRIFTERKHWYRAAHQAEQDWGAPIHVQMAILWRESGFRPHVRAPRKTLLGIIPWGRKSSSRGFTQAVDGTWKWYINSTGNTGASRSDFGDSADFVGWYIAKSHQVNDIRKSDAYRQYLAYHQGHGNYRKRSYAKRPQVRKAAREVEAMAGHYKDQLLRCGRRLRRYL